MEVSGGEGVREGTHVRGGDGCHRRWEVLGKGGDRCQVREVGGVREGR